MDKEKNKSKKKPVIIIIGLIILAVMIVGGVVVYNNFFDKPQTDSNGVVGKISDNWDIGNKSETSPTNVGIQIPGYGTAEMKEGDGEPSFEHWKSQIKRMRILCYLKA